MTVSKAGAKHREQGHTYHSDEVEAIYLACVHISPDHAHGACGDCTHKAAFEGARLADLEVERLTALISTVAKTDAKQLVALYTELNQLRQRVSPATETCSCPEFCTYHARSNFEAMRLQIEGLQIRIDNALKEDHNANDAEAAMARWRMREALTGKKVQ